LISAKPKSDFSKFRPSQQALVIKALIRIVETEEYWRRGYAACVRAGLEAKLCIGDGYIFVHKDAVQATYFAAQLAHLIEVLVAKKMKPEFHFRMSVHVGPVYTFWDTGRGRDGDWNYIGDGINGGQRVLGAIGKEIDDVLFISAEVRQGIIASNKGTEPNSAILDCLQNRGRRLDKHNNPWRVYEVNHAELCYPTTPLLLVR
jgi:class 3 adenylate cyclase